MVEIIQQLTLFFEQIVESFGYPGVFLILLLENVLTPIPTEPLMPLAGKLAAEGRMNFFGVWAAAIIGATIGSSILYLIGLRGGEPLVRALIRRFGRYAGMNEDSLDRALGLFARYGGWVIFIGRFLPVVRPTVALVAGMSAMRLVVFIPCVALSATIITFIYIYAGYLLGENWQQILQVIGQNESLILAVIIVIGMTVIGLIGRRLFRSRANVHG